MIFEFSRENFEESSNIKFHKTPSSEGRVIPCDGGTDGQINMTKLIAACRNFANAPNKGKVKLSLYILYSHIEGLETKLHSFVPSTLDADEWSITRPAALSPGLTE
jgi:hypothetical protein